MLYFTDSVSKSDSLLLSSNVNFVVAQPDQSPQNLFGVFSQQGRTAHMRGRLRQLDRIAYSQVLASRWVIDFHYRAGRAQSRLLGDFLHGEDRAARHVEKIERGHHVQ